MHLVVPARQHLSGYLDAVQRGWSPNTMRPEAGREDALAIAEDAGAFLAGMDDPDALAPPVTLPDGSTVHRLPGRRRWLWDGQFCGAIGLRWQPGTAQLPAHVLGHIGYAVVPWKRRRGYATQALRQLLPLAVQERLPYVELTADEDNVASQRVILACGGTLVERFRPPSPPYSPAALLRYRIELTR